MPLKQFLILIINIIFGIGFALKKVLTGDPY